MNLEPSNVNIATAAIGPPPPLSGGPGTSGTPLSWRIVLVVAVLGCATAAYGLQPMLGTRGTAALGGVCFFGFVAAASTNLRGINGRTIAWGIALQFALRMAQIGPVSGDILGAGGWNV
jgi:hypothetical protein